MSERGHPSTQRPKASRWAAYFTGCYLSADPRWLGLFRIVYGGLITVDLLRRWVQAREYYTNDGFLPNHFSIFRPMGERLFSLYHAFSTLGEVHVAFALTLLVFLSYTVGYKTKLCQILVAILVPSLDARNLFVENGGDVVVNLLAFLTVFLPLGRRLSIDAVRASLGLQNETTAAELNDRKPSAVSSEPFLSLIVAFLLVQLAAIYFFNGVHKSGQGWRNGTAIYWFLQQDRIVTAFGIFLRNHVSLPMIQAFTYGALTIEYSLPWLILNPLFYRWTRRVALLLAIGLHGGIALTSRLGPFSYVMCTFFLLFFGAEDWRFLGRWFGREARRRTVIYDADCGICLWLCRVLKRVDPFERLTFVGNDEVERFPSGVTPELVESSVVVVDASGKVHTEERAVRSALVALPGGILLAFWFWIPGFQQLANLGYQRVASHRLEISTWFGFAACGIPLPAEAKTPAATRDTAESEKESPTEPKPRTSRLDRANAGFLVRELLVALTAAMLLSQLSIDNPWLKKRIRGGRTPWMAEVVDRFRLLEGWGMFAPEPPYEDGRVIVDGRTKDGRKLDPFTLQEPNFDPNAPHGWDHEQFWCDYSNKIRFQWFTQHRPFLREYLRKWHEYKDRPEDELVSFDVWWIQDKEPKPGKILPDPLPPQKLTSYGFVKDSGAKEWLAKTRSVSKP